MYFGRCKWNQCHLSVTFNKKKFISEFKHFHATGEIHHFKIGHSTLYAFGCGIPKKCVLPFTDTLRHLQHLVKGFSKLPWIFKVKDVLLLKFTGAKCLIELPPTHESHIKWDTCREDFFFYFYSSYREFAPKRNELYCRIADFVARIHLCKSFPSKFLHTHDLHLFFLDKYRNVKHYHNQRRFLNQCTLVSIYLPFQRHRSDISATFALRNHRIWKQRLKYNTLPI
jgi:hypothetical protein